MNWFVPLLLVAAQAATAPAPTPREVDPKVAAQVPIIAGKLEQWQGAWGAAGGKLACKTVKSSGDEEIDALGCASMIACVKPEYAALKTIADGRIVRSGGAELALELEAEGYAGVAA